MRGQVYRWIYIVKKRIRTWSPWRQTASMLTVFLLLVDQVLFTSGKGLTLPNVRTFEPISYDHVTLREQHHVVKRSSSARLTFNFNAYGSWFPVRLFRDETVLHPDLVVETSHRKLPYDVTSTYVGHIEGHNFSRVHGLITATGHFEGKLFTHNETYFIERAHHYFKEPVEFHSVIYKLSDVTFPAAQTSCAFDSLRTKQREMTKGVRSAERPLHETTSGEHEHWLYGEENEEGDHERYHRTKRAVDPTKVICELYMQADHLYYQRYGSDVDSVIEKLTQHVQAVNNMYNTIDFDGSGQGDNIGFIIKKIKVFTDSTAVGYKYPGQYSVDYYLDLHSKDNYDAFCLSYLFTYRDFANGVLGLAWIGEVGAAGGVCEKHNTFQGEGKSLNTGIVTVLNYGQHILSAVSHVTFAHEIGHNMGSGHDPENNAQCTPGGEAGNYIMYARASSGNKPNNVKMSTCSKTSIQTILKHKARGPTGCFVASMAAICGNRVVETGEDCDCGWTEDCTESCCNPQVSDPSAPGVETPCTRKSSASCSPSEGPCCTSTCQYTANTVSCRAASDCLSEASCGGSSSTCPASTHVVNATQCGNTDDYLVCLNGECSGSVCLAHGREPCICKGDDPTNWRDEKLCQVCCKDGAECKSSYSLSDVPDAMTLAGSPCNEYQGYCDVFKICRAVDPSGPLTNLRKLLTSGEAFDTLKSYLKTHWYIGLAAGFGMVIIICFVVKFCSKSHALKDPDSKQPYIRRSSRNKVTPEPKPDTWM